MEALILLPGVARKTANVVLNIAFNQSVGIVVDTHVLRLSNRFGWISSQDREKAETELMKIIPKKEWIPLSLLLIHHGRSQCTARNPSCSVCHLKDLCPSYQNKRK
jgi:endonuclease-3